MATRSARNLLIFLAKASGFMVVSILAPQFPYFVLKSYLKSNKKVDKRKLKRNLVSLETQGYLEIYGKQGDLKIKVTDKGKKKALEFDLFHMKIEKQKKWDGIWRVVIFDIPETKRHAREVLRQKLQELGFAMLQKSVFVIPYPCRDEIEYIRNVFGIYKYVNLIEAKSLDSHNEKMYKGRFGLK